VYFPPQTASRILPSPMLEAAVPHDVMVTDVHPFKMANDAAMLRARARRLAERRHRRDHVWLRWLDRWMEKNRAAMEAPVGVGWGFDEMDPYNSQGHEIG
jgi:hypothetical protein